MSKTIQEAIIGSAEAKLYFETVRFVIINNNSYFNISIEYKAGNHWKVHSTGHAPSLEKAYDFLRNRGVAI